jgi:hypothetical protein
MAVSAIEGVTEEAAGARPASRQGRLNLVGKRLGGFELNVIGQVRV